MDVRDYERQIWELKQDHKRELCYITTRLRHAAREQADRDFKQFISVGFLLGITLGIVAGSYLI